MTFSHAEALLLALPRFTDAGASAYKPGLSRMHALLDALGRPESRYPVLHVAGTNGKGSTCSFMASLLGAMGFRVGLHTSPHLVHVGERLRVNGFPANESWLAEAISRHAPLWKDVQPSYFEATVALAFERFAAEKVDVAVVEVGLGGRLDATNVVHPAVTLVTEIGLDHADLLGPTEALIAREKAGIFKMGVPALTNATHPEALPVLREVAEALGAPFEDVGQTTRWLGDTLITPHATYAAIPPSLPGAHQRRNAALAVRAVETWRDGSLPEAEVRAGLAEVRQRAGLRARLEEVRPGVWVDVAHNPQGLAASLREVQARCTGPLYVAFGCMADKDARAMVALLADADVRVTPLELSVPRALPAETLAAWLREAGVATRPAQSPEDAWKAIRPGEAWLFTGSFVVAGAVVEPNPRL